MAFPAYAKLVFNGVPRDRESGVIRTEMETGPAKQSKFKSRVMLTRTVVYHLDSLADYNNFIAWHKVDINYGASWFSWTDPVDAVVKQARIPGGKLDYERARRKTLDRWEIGFKIETWDS